MEQRWFHQALNHDFQLLQSGVSVEKVGTSLQIVTNPVWLTNMLRGIVTRCESLYFYIGPENHAVANALG
jgi:hypothetical protein